jgi:hypothetical protein
MTNHPNLFLRDASRRDAIERDAMPHIKRPPFVLQLAFIVFFTITGLAGLREGGMSLRDGIGLRERGQAAQAVVTRRYTSKSDGSTNYHVTYAYPPPGAGHARTRSAKVSLDQWNAACQGCKIEIRYDPERPQVSRLPSERPIAKGLALTVFMGLLAVFGLGLSWQTMRIQRRHRRILRHGKLRMGTILDVADEERGENKDLHITLQLQFDGDDTTLSYTWSDNKLRGKLPQVGQRIAALHLSDEDFELA